MELWTDPSPRHLTFPYISQLLAESPTEQILKNIPGFDLATASRDLNFQKKHGYQSLRHTTFWRNEHPWIPPNSSHPNCSKVWGLQGSAQRILGASEELKSVWEFWLKAGRKCGFSMVFWVFCQEKWCENGRLMGYTMGNNWPTVILKHWGLIS